MTARSEFTQAAESLLGMPVLWSQKGPDSYDCSGLVTACLKKVGGPDLRHTHNAQALHDVTRALHFGELPLAGDLVFYGASPKAVIHVAIYDELGGVVSADGATSHVTTLRAALKDEHARIRRHTTIHYRNDTPYVALRRFALLDDIDKVTR